MPKYNEVLALTVEGYRLKEEHEAHQKREAVSPFEKENVKSFLVETVFELVPHGLAGVAVLVELEHHEHPNQIPGNDVH